MNIAICTRARGRLIALVTLLAVILATWVSPAVAHADMSACPAQVAALDANQDKIAAHNGRMPPGGVGPPEVVGPYNQEAAQLNAEKESLLGSLQQCEVTIDKLRGDGPKPKPLTDKVSKALGDGTAAAAPRYTTPTPPVKLSDGRMTIPAGHPLRPLWDVVKKLDTPMRPFPNAPLQGARPPRAGEKHASGHEVGTRQVDGKKVPAISADHIVPKVEILYLPRFLELTPTNQWEVLNAAVNLQWLPSQVNSKNKNSRSAEDMQDVDPDWKEEQIELQDRLRQILTDLIAQLADSQVP